MPRLLSRSFVPLLVFLSLLPGLSARAQPLDLILPTPNDALLRGDGPAFYMYTDRNFKGVRSRPWEGGQYGFVRNQKETPSGIVFTRFHEGVDIQPLHRDATGEPLDPVWAVADGRVVYANTVANRSSYGRYVVVEHWWDDSPFYSLYAHLGDVRVKRGQTVAQGDRLGTIGYTGTGINKRRAHLHFEINLLLSSRFQDWYTTYVGRRSPNHHGVFNGLNMTGLDVATLYLAHQQNPRLSMAEFVTSQEPYYTVRIPNEGLPELWERYPWLGGTYDPAAPSIEVSFTTGGLPVRLRPGEEAVREPEVVEAQRTAFRYDDVTRHLTGAGQRVTLSKGGREYVALLTLGARPVLQSDPAAAPTSSAAGTAGGPYAAPPPGAPEAFEAVEGGGIW